MNGPSLRQLTAFLDDFHAEYRLALGPDGPAPFVTSYMGGLTCSTIDEKEHTVEAMLSTPLEDRWGEIIEPTGWKLKNFRRNPVVLLNHRDDALPIGKALDVQIRESGLWIKAQFAVEATDIARQTWALVVARVLRAWSPGWWPLKWESIDGKESGEGPPPGRRGIRFIEQELWEASQVTIPATPNALTLHAPSSMQSLVQLAELSIVRPDLVSDMILAAMREINKAKGPTTVQTLIFDSEKFSVGEAKKWARDHDFTDAKVDEPEDGKTIRLRQHDPSEFDEDGMGPGKFRTIKLDDGVKAVIGVLKKDVGKKKADAPTDDEESAISVTVSSAIARLREAGEIMRSR
jgi:phage head maturation protease